MFAETKSRHLISSLTLQGVVGHPMWILGTELGAYAKAALICKDISLAPQYAQYVFKSLSTCSLLKLQPQIKQLSFAKLLAYQNIKNNLIFYLKGYASPFLVLVIINLFLELSCLYTMYSDIFCSHSCLSSSRAY